jgi:hypothetical protein
MGTWGPASFSDDIASDLREDFRAAIADGLSPAAPTDKILAEYRPDPADPPYAATVWLALAAPQWKLGRLEVRVRDAALAAIDCGGAIAAWLDTKDEARRRRILADTRAQLLSPPPEPWQGAISVCTCDWRPGDLVAYRTLGGNQITLQVQMLHADKGGTYPSLEVLEGLGPDLPGAELIDALPFARAEIRGRPDPKHISTSYVERQNLNTRMGMRRFTRLTNAFGKKLDNHHHAISLFYMYYNFGRIHRTLRITPAMAADVSEKIAGLIP